MRKKRSTKVLIVGDNPRINEIAAKQKDLLSHRPIKVKRCEDALKVAAKHPPIDLLFTDIMATEIDGEDFATQFTKLSPRTKVIYMIL